MHYSKVRRDKHGLCNLCRIDSDLTWDHVPPQGSMELSPIEMRTVLQAFAEKVPSRFRLSQNGVKYRTLCKACNERLGQEFDPILNHLAQEVGKLVTSTIDIPPAMEVRTKPQKLMRAVLGHLVAAKIDIDDVLFDNDIRRMVFDDAEPIPEDIHIFYWIHPYPLQVVLRDVGMPAKRGDFGSFMFCHILKFFPCAFLVTNVDEYEGLPSLTRWRDAAWDETVELPFMLRDAKGAHWPEAPDHGNILFGGQSMASSVIGVPRKPRSKTQLTWRCT